MKWIGFCFSLMACAPPVDKDPTAAAPAVEYDSLAQRSAVLRYPDTSVTIHGIQKFLRDSMALDLMNLGFGGGEDTLIDLNSDGRVDYLREWYGLAGSGLKNRVYVALANGPVGSYRPSEQLNGLGNPTFYLDSARVYGYYVANGGGEATSFSWAGDRLDTLIDIRIVGDEPDGLGWVHRVRDLGKGTSYSYVAEEVDLPAAFRYMEYEPVIRGDGTTR